MKQSVKESVNKLVNKAVNKSVKESIKESMNQSGQNQDHLQGLCIFGSDIDVSFSPWLTVLVVECCIHLGVCMSEEEMLCGEL